MLDRIEESVLSAQVATMNNQTQIDYYQGRGPVCVWHRLVGWEQEVFAQGEAGRLLLIQRIQDSSRKPVVRAWLLRILTQMSDKSIVQPVLEILKRERDSRLTVEALRVVAMSRNVKARVDIRGFFGRDDVDLKTLLWTLAMLGDVKCEDDYITLVESLVNVRPLPAPPSDDTKDIRRLKGLEQAPRPNLTTKLTEDLTNDLSNLALLGNPRIIPILIEALSSANPQVMRTADYLLRSILDPADLGGCGLGDGQSLFSLRTYRAMLTWWKENNPKIYWDASRSRFAKK